MALYHSTAFPGASWDAQIPQQPEVTWRKTRVVATSLFRKKEWTVLEQYSIHQNWAGPSQLICYVTRGLGCEDFPEASGYG